MKYQLEDEPDDDYDDDDDEFGDEDEGDGDDDEEEDDDEEPETWQVGSRGAIPVNSGDLLTFGWRTT
jgi:hypothetical protein